MALFERATRRTSSGSGVRRFRLCNWVQRPRLPQISSTAIRPEVHPGDDDVQSGPRPSSDDDAFLLDVRAVDDASAFAVSFSTRSSAAAAALMRGRRLE